MCGIVTQTEELQDVPVLLPHEVLASIARQSDIHNFVARDHLTESARDHLLAAEQTMGQGTTDRQSRLMD